MHCSKVKCCQRENLTVFVVFFFKHLWGKLPAVPSCSQCRETLSGIKPDKDTEYWCKSSNYAFKIQSVHLFSYYLVRLTVAGGRAEQPNVFFHSNFLSSSLESRRVFQGKLRVTLHSHKVVSRLWPLINLQLCGCAAFSTSFTFSAQTGQFSDVAIILQGSCKFHSTQFGSP